ncbi:TonB-dependent receptor [Acetobacter sp. LMG 1636]|uniref:TonB-dependent receptor n=2 Tax=Acetobacter fallax TaxID=1737473 RepID=A0ABX0KEG4_9PROT|nr:TonB-dependent receptor [Acetobacter fallax]NHO33987.1 TonB-dependent receptor [Acetobacter fallax]NHO37521.1 TonB-dependent receptor [Acetobacter fallax]
MQRQASEDPVTPKNVREKKSSASGLRARQAIKSEDESVNVVMHRASHGSSEVMTAHDIEKFVPGTNPLKVIAQQPGVLLTAADPMGQDSWATQLYVRGFFQNQIGFTLDGVPLGELTYRNYNGLGINQAISPDNISRMDVSQGAGALDTPSTNNLGGAISFTSMDPAHKHQVDISQTFGSNSAFRTFVRINSGDLNASGTRFFVSYARSNSDKWKGSGPLFDQKVNAKLVQPIGEQSEISAFFDWDDQQYLSYQDLSLNYLHTLGPRLDNFYPNYKGAYLAAQGIFTNGQNKTNDPLDAMFYDSSAIARDYLGGLKAHITLADNLTWDSVAYGHSNLGWGGYASPFASSPNGAPLRYQEHQGSIARYGFTTGVTYEVARNTINTGVWYENNRYIMDYFAYQMPLLGEGEPLNPLSMSSFKNPVAQLWGTTYNTNTFEYHLQDTYHILKNLSVHAGFRSMLVTTHGGGTVNDAAYTGQSQLPSGSLTTAAAFLPHISANWLFLPGHELYFDISQNRRAYAQGGYQMGQAWGVTNQATFRELQKTIKPESDWAYELGYRYNSSLLSASLNLYRVNFFNRLQSMASASIVDPVSTVVNVGAVTMNGVDAAFTIRPVEHLSIYNSVSYNDSRYGSDITTAGVVYHQAGKKVVNYPDFMYKAGVDYAYKRMSAHFDVNYIGKRYLSYMNDTSVPGYWIANLGAKYQIGTKGFLKNMTFEFNVYNLFNASYISTMGENGNPFTGDYQSFMIGAPRQYFGTVRATF